MENSMITDQMKQINHLIYRIIDKHFRDNNYPGWIKINVTFNLN